MTTLMHASRQWATRPADERFTSLPELYSVMKKGRDNSLQTVRSSRQIEFMPVEDDPEHKGLLVKAGREPAVLSHWSFGQAAQLAGAPAGYLRDLPAPLVADCLNYGMKFNRDARDTGLLVRRDDEALTLAAATGPNYGRIWNEEIVKALMDKFGDGATGPWKVPGEFGKNVPITKDNTTIYGSDRDMFVFLADEENRVEVANRRNGQSGSLARGFFVWNSEVGSQSIGAAFFLFDYACSNRIVWGAEGFKEIRIRHTASAPDRWLEEISPVLIEYSNAAAKPVEETIRRAQEEKVKGDLDNFLKNRFTVAQTTAIKAAHEREEGRPIETLWDVTTGVTAYAKSIRNQDDRVALERKGGAILDLVAA